MFNFNFIFPTYGKYIYLMDSYQQLLCDNGDTETVALEVFNSTSFGELEETEMTGYMRKGEYISLYIRGDYIVVCDANTEEEAYNKGVENWEKADFGLLKNCEILD